MFAVICDWYERYTRGTFNFKKMQELPSDIEFDYLPALLTADEYKRMHMSSMYDILWPKWDTKTAEYQMSKALAVFKVKHAALSFFDGDYEVIRAENGYDPMRIDRLMSLAAHALYTGEVIWVLDTMRERSELHTFADYLLADITMQRADLSHPQLQNLPLPDDGMSDFIRIDTPDPGSIPGVPHCPIRFYKQAPLPAYFSKELDDYFDSEVSGILGEEVVQAQSARQSGHGSSVLDHDVPLVPDESFATSRSDTNPGFSFIDFLRMNDQDFQEERAPKIEQPARIMVRDNGSMASLATSTRSKLALKLEPPPPLRVIKTPKVEDTAFFSSPLSRPSLGYEVLQERASMISFRDESHLEESHSEEADDNPQRGSFESSTTDQTSQSVRYSLSPLLERDSIQPQFRGRSSNRTQVERPPLTRDGTPQPGTVKAAIASFNVRMSTSTNSLSPYDGLDSRARTRSGSAQAQRLSFARPQSEKSGKDSVAPVQPEQLTTTKSEFDKSSDDAVSISQPQQSSATKSQSENTVEEIVSAVHTTQNSSDHQQTSASKPPPESSFDSLTTADTFESEARPVTPDQADLSAAYRRKSEYGSVTILASPSTRKESPALTASDLPLHPSGSQITISKALNAPASSVSSPTEPAPPVGNSESNSPDISTLSAKFQDLTTSPIRAPKQIVEVVKQSPPPSQPSSTPTETKSGSDLISSTEISFPSPPPSNPPPIPRPMAVDPLVIDPHLLAGAAQMFRVAAQNLAYDLIYAVSIFAPNHTSATPVTADEIHIRYLVAHGMQSATQDLNKKLHLNALRSLGIFYFQPPKDANFDPEDWSIGRFLAVPSRFGSSRIRNSGIVVAAFRRASTPPLSNDYAESLQFQEFVDAFKKTIFPPPTFKSKIPQRMASSPALREEAGFPANEAVEMRTAAPSPRATPEIAGPSRLRAAKSRLNLTNSNKAPSSLGKKSGMSWRRPWIKTLHLLPLFRERQECRTM
ncbi:hypothetical protein M7I_3460 [Glarea lozoyensis 74030]|uniref:Uncharacterized protein n=1 Tax=Glarea lozoyensis (strain ATCC 74030 / MF5533) TaxID=1104152 RepID=H0ELJ6_GLAL7|nr:hypothetical protein M7I_3460 [Glarea lozoyensis 74030]